MVNDSKITFFCALKYQDIKDSNYYYLFRNLLLHSIEQNFKLDDIAEFIVACPENELSAIEDLFSHSSIPHRVLDENEVCPEFKTIPFDGYKKQMALKLAISGFVNTDYYLIVDPDVILYRKSSFEDLIIDGKPRLGINNDIHFYHKLWLENAIDAFCGNNGNNGNKNKIGKIFMGITPQIFITEIAKKSIGELKQIYKSDSFISALIKLEGAFKERNKESLKKSEEIQEQINMVYEKSAEASKCGDAVNAAKLTNMAIIIQSRFSIILLKFYHAWTEYTLYWSYVLQNGLKDLYDRDFSLYGNIYSGKKLALYTTEKIPEVNGVELEKDILTGNILRQEEPFIVIQSTAGHNIADLEAILRKYEVISE